ncbi:unnamed protein product [Paramecium primaurelia]|uniref:Uncharacterized protein n=1 Tax=Paramecium primaurelia TaxID=5886 RepID=A0A8S1QPL9_PARPR|nr:unnamed protein product [Paramecium primaurelia]
MKEMRKRLNRIISSSSKVQRYLVEQKEHQKKVTAQI